MHTFVSTTVNYVNITKVNAKMKNQKIKVLHLDLYFINKWWYFMRYRRDFGRLYLIREISIYLNCFLILGMMVFIPYNS